MIEEQKKANKAAVPDDDEQADARNELRLVKNEVRALANSIQETKKEIAALYTAPEDDSGTRINIVKGELDSVVAATEDAKIEKKQEEKEKRWEEQHFRY